MEFATGDIITFVDSDDYVSSDYLDTIASAFNEDNNIDVVFFEFYRVNNQNQIISHHNLPLLQDDYYSNLMNLSNNDMFGYTWIKAFRREVLENKFFDESLLLWEDEIFTCLVMQNTMNIKCINEFLYYYVRNEDTLSKKVHDDYCVICNLVFLAWKKLLRASNNKDTFLEKKASHFMHICKYYVLEQKINLFTFCFKMSNCDFLMITEVNDSFVRAIKSRNYLYIVMYYCQYKVRSFFYNFFKKPTINKSSKNL